MPKAANGHRQPRRCSAIPISMGQNFRHWRRSGGCSRSSLWHSFLCCTNSTGAGNGINAFGWSCQRCCIALLPYTFGEEKRRVQNICVQKVSTTWDLTALCRAMGAPTIRLKKRVRASLNTPSSDGCMNTRMGNSLADKAGDYMQTAVMEQPWHPSFLEDCSSQ